MSFNKSFRMNLSEGLTLLNTSDRDSYLKAKIEHFTVYDNYSSKEERLGFMQEILDMYYRDITTATIDTLPLSGVKLFDINVHRNTMIMYYDIVVLMGTVFLNVFDRPGNKLVDIHAGMNGPVSTASMATSAYNELLCSKYTDVVPYGANLIFATLLETELKSLVKSKFVQEWLQLLRNKIDTGTVTLSAAETDLFNYLCHSFELLPQVTDSIYDSVSATTVALYDLLETHSIVSASDNEAKKLILNKYTLNQFLGSQMCQAKVEVPYLEMAKLIFGTCHLNLRNNLAHCNLGYLNYHTSCISAVLYSLMSMISDRHCLK